MAHPPVRRPDFAGNSAELRELSAWFVQVWTRQVGPPVGGRRRRFLNEGEFLRMMARCMRELDIAGGTPDPRSLDNWRKGVSVPREQFVAPLLDALLGDTPDEEAERVRGRELWQAAEDAKNRSSTARRRPAGLARPASIVDEAPCESDWKAGNTEPLQQGLAELLVHPPARGANTPLEFPLRISLSFAEFPDEIEDATLALTEATLIPSYNGCRPVPGTRLGEGEAMHATLLFRGGVWRIDGPRLPNNHLQGEPLVSEPLCTIQCDGEAEDSLTLFLRSGYRALVVVPEQPEVDTNPVKQRILQALVQKCVPRDREGIVTWGRATLRRKPPK